jgi:hypothetical protein
MMKNSEKKNASSICVRMLCCVNRFCAHANHLLWARRSAVSHDAGVLVTMSDSRRSWWLLLGALATRLTLLW